MLGWYKLLLKKSRMGKEMTISTAHRKEMQGSGAAEHAPSQEEIQGPGVAAHASSQRNPNSGITAYALLGC